MADNKKLYRSVMVQIPEPRFMVFCNGEREQPAIQKQKLSDIDMYEHHADEPKPEPELKVTVINLTPGYNDEKGGGCR